MATPKTETLSACVDSYGSAVGMPQLCGEWMSNQIFWLVITLLVIFFVLSRIALPRIAAVLAERQGTITNDIAAAEDLKAKAAAAEEAYQQALIDARAEAARIVEATKAEIKADLDFDWVDTSGVACRGWYVGLVNHRTKKITANEELALAA
jgi:F-type H+-transporting ATPase subunit b